MYRMRRVLESKGLGVAKPAKGRPPWRPNGPSHLGVEKQDKTTAS